jgi:hypothetical protein
MDEALEVPGGGSQGEKSELNSHGGPTAQRAIEPLPQTPYPAAPSATDSALNSGLMTIC